MSVVVVNKLTRKNERKLNKSSERKEREIDADKYDNSNQRT